MSRPESVSDVKGRGRGSNQHKQRAPKEGTKLRRLYDLLMTGERVSAMSIVGPNSVAGHVSQLKNFYNLEIKTKRGQHGWTQCIGIWEGGELIPLERVNYSETDE